MGLRTKIQKTIDKDGNKSDDSATSELSETSWESAETYDWVRKGEGRVENKNMVKKTFRTHFDIINSKLQTLRVRQKAQKKQYFSLFRGSQERTENHRRFLEEGDKLRATQLVWVQESYDKYNKMMEDFNNFKIETNKQV